jgi:hypothetical protein
MHCAEHSGIFSGIGAQERTRTFTAVKLLAPEASASTNSATWARAVSYGPGTVIVNRDLVKLLRIFPCLAP